MVPLTDDQRRLVEDYARQWDPVAVVRSRWPAMWRACLAVGMTEDDVRQAGMEGVIRAATDFDPTRGAQFHTYAHWWLRSRVGRTASRLDARRLGRQTSGDRTVKGERSERSLWEVLGVSDPTRPQDDPEEFDRLDELKRRVGDVLRVLVPRYRLVLELRHGLDGGGSRTLEEVAALLGVTRERVRQIEAKALSRVAVPLQVGCFDHVKLGRKEFNVSDRNGVAEADKPTACPTCGKDYRNQSYRRCYECSPVVPKKPPAAIAVHRRRTTRARTQRPRPATVADLAKAMTAADGVRQAIDGLDPATARQVLGWVADRLEG